MVNIQSASFGSKPMARALCRATGLVFIVAALFLGSVAGAQAQAYVINFDAAAPSNTVTNIVDGQSATVTGNVLTSGGADAGFDYTLTYVITGGPHESPSPAAGNPADLPADLDDDAFPSSYPPNGVTDGFGRTTTTISLNASEFGSGSPGFTTQGNFSSISLIFLGEDSTTNGFNDWSSIDYYRDTSSLMRLTMTLDGGREFANTSFTLADIDYNLDNGGFLPSNTAGNHNGLFSYIDEVEIISGAGSNVYTPQSGVVVIGDRARAAFTDGNGNNIPDAYDDGRVDFDRTDGNLTVYNAGNIGDTIEFTYYDNGTGVEGDPDGLHDFDSVNQLIALQSGITFDAILPVTLGNRVWYDANDNGTIDGLESNYGIDGVTVQLLDDGGSVISTTTTADGGFYNFTVDITGTKLLDGDYSVRIPASNFGNGNSLNDWTSSSSADVDPDNDTDNDDNGNGSGSGTDITSGVVTIAAGTEPTQTVDTDDANGNLTIDFGFTDLCSAGNNDLGGNIFRDYNSDGSQDVGEPGWTSGVTITAYDDDGNSVTATINPDGSYIFDDIFDTESDIRLEFSGLPDWATSGVQGDDSGTTVQFHSAASCSADLAVQNPADYCQANPGISAACYLQPNDATANAWLDEPAIVQIPYESGTTATDSTALNTLQDEAYMTVMATNGEVGSVFGLGFDNANEIMYASAFMKRHVPYGPAGPDAIYKIEGGTVTTLLQLNTLVADTPAGTDNHSPSGNNYQLDDIWDEVGKNSFGDLALSDDGRTLYVVTLTDTDRRLYEISLPADGSNPVAGDIQAFSLPSPTDCPSHPSTGAGELNRNIRPGALHYGDGLLYVGLTCTAESTQDTDDLKGYVYTFNPANSTFSSLLVTIPFNYTRGNIIENPTTAPGNFYPWIATQLTLSTSPAINGNSENSSYPMPWLMDIGIADDGCMVLGITDRFGHLSSGANNPPDQLNGNAGGDILKACNLSGIWTLENNGNDGVNGATAGAGTNHGPGGGEFFYHDGFTLANAYHNEISNGGFAILRGAGEVVLGVYDPSPVSGDLPSGGPNVFDSGGFAYLSTEDGSRTRSYMLFNRDDYPSFGFDKASATGGLVLQCEAAPLEIGNYVWFDEDGDGIQDPSELPLPNIEVSLYNITGTLVTTTTTDGSGEYYFNDANVTGGLEANTDYEIRIDLSQSDLVSYTLTAANVDSGTTISDSVDSDAVESSGFAVISATTGDAGQNDHTFDFGFVPPGTITIVKNTDGSDTTFNFTSSDSELNAVSLATSGAIGSSATITKTVGTYTITEDALAGWTLESISFSGDSDGGSSSTGSTATIDLDAGENITVTFTNSLDPTEGTITIIKNTDGSDGTFNFSSADAELNAVSLTTSGGTASSAVITKTTGTYTITEDLLADWTLTDVTVSETITQNSTISVDDRQAVLTIETGENITVTFTNSPDPILNLIKSAATTNASPAAIGDPVVYTLRIENTGFMTVTQIALTDTYDPNYLIYDSSTPAETTTTANTVTWSGADGDSGPLDGYLPLAPGGVFTVTVNFTATKP